MQLWRMVRSSLDDARSVLQRYFGYADFRSAQLPAIESVLSGTSSILVGTTNFINASIDKNTARRTIHQK
jgi:hypothetical protein